jgi:hypothetical protein
MDKSGPPKQGRGLLTRSYQLRSTRHPMEPRQQVYSSVNHHKQGMCHLVAGPNHSWILGL